MSFLNFRHSVLERKPLIGTFINLGSALTAEIAGKAGFDWILLDHEHGPGSEETLLQQLWACGSAGATPLVRVAWNDPVRLKRVLDLGPAGVMIPMINSRAEAENAVQAVRYPPAGIRGVSKSNRSTGFGREFAERFSRAGGNYTTIVQIETREAVESAGEIAAVDGVDALFIGPLDLSANLGCCDDQDHPNFVDARKKVCAAAREHGKSAGILQMDTSRLGMHLDEGFTLIAIGSDSGAVFGGMNKIIAESRETLAK